MRTNQSKIIASTIYVATLILTIISLWTWASQLPW